MATIIKITSDSSMGKYVYCHQHCRVHETGWCKVEPEFKVALKADTLEAAIEEANAMNLKDTWKRKYDAPEGAIWVCQACGKSSKNQVDVGDESCFMNAVLARDDDTLIRNSSKGQIGRVVECKLYEPKEKP